MQTGHENIEKTNGQYIKTVKYYQIQNDKYHLEFINPDTIGQFTGLHDKNGKEIYEGDIIRIKNSLIEIEGKIIFDTIDSAFKVYDKENDFKEMLWYTNKEFEVLRQYIR